ncbi:DUF300-domain-containing protein [Aspergillus ibericus CBS 121593]|uniref:DUF300-domain-containing protein n=1 Tax=Aspergillus ibericus CBS 121593 TaxID=1448316 RepID=A0A395GK03_9EURO|nr:DUF300-domain-containing protein [Aspergillus ibericus CBS 121593]RAK95821.1 DUF300-domain-containing protein [Aspergillus ibericus CBS 121593]
MIISGASTVLACLIIFALMMRHATRFSNPTEQIRVMRISSVVPVYSIFSFLSVCFPNGYVYFSSWPDPFEGVALYSFFLLLCEFIAPSDEQRLQLIATQQIKPSRLRRRRRSPPMDGLTWFRRTYYVVVQYPAVALITTVVACITQGAGKYCLESKEPYFAHIWITIIKNVSISFAVMAVVKFYAQLKKDMEGHRALAKLLAFKLIVGLTFVESILFTILRTASILKASSVMTYTDITIGLPTMIICIQMVPLACFFHFAYSVTPYSVMKLPLANEPRYKPVDEIEEIKVRQKYQGGPLGIYAWAMFFNPVAMAREFVFPLTLMRAAARSPEHQVLTPKQLDERQSPAAAPPPPLNPRSCIPCNRRKVRCDRHFPCGRCVKGAEECIFPGPKRAPRQLKRPPIAEVLAQLRLLEEEVQKLRSQPLPPTADPGSASGSSPLGIPAGQGPVGPSPQEGRLVVKEGLQFVSAVGGNWRDHSLRDTFLQPARIQSLWRVYQDNVAPLIAVLHRPSVDVMIRQELDNINPDPAREALILAVCFAAIVTLQPEQCRQLLGLDYDQAIQSYIHAVDQALVRANFIKTQNICVLQAAVVFLLTLRYRSDSRLVWAASAVVVRVAQGQGVHRDGEVLGLSPFDAEMRRRLWWNICILDMISSEDQGTDTQVHPGMFDTRLPSNINGEDLSPSMTELPPEKVGATDITLAIVQCEIISQLYWPNGSHDPKSPSKDSRESRVMKLASRIQNHYLEHLNLGVPIEWVYATIIRLTVSKLWVSVHYKDLWNPATGTESELEVSQRACDEAFAVAVEAVEFTILLQTNETTSQWSWLCKSYKQWHAVAFILAELCTRPITPATNRAWEMVNEIHRQWEEDDSQTSVMLRKPLRRLMERTAFARKARLEPSPLRGPPNSVIDPDVPGIGPDVVVNSDLYSLYSSGFGESELWIREP